MMIPETSDNSAGEDEYHFNIHSYPNNGSSSETLIRLTDLPRLTQVHSHTFLENYAQVSLGCSSGLPEELPIFSRNFLTLPLGWELYDFRPDLFQQQDDIRLYPFWLICYQKGEPLSAAYVFEPVQKDIPMGFKIWHLHSENPLNAPSLPQKDVNI